MGLSLEKRLPFQENVASAECEGAAFGLPDAKALAAAANGVADNFVMTVSCGKCGHKWEDGLGYKTKTVVRCSSCQALNAIETSDFTAH